MCLCSVFLKRRSRLFRIIELLRVHRYAKLHIRKCYYLITQSNGNWCENEMKYKNKIDYNADMSATLIIFCNVDKY